MNPLDRILNVAFFIEAICLSILLVIGIIGAIVLAPEAGGLFSGNPSNIYLLNQFVGYFSVFPVLNLWLIQRTQKLIKHSIFKCIALLPAICAFLSILMHMRTEVSLSFGLANLIGCILLLFLGQGYAAKEKALLYA